jgi:hypothetical protein
VSGLLGEGDKILEIGSDLEKGLFLGLPFTGVGAVSILGSLRVRVHSPMDDHWCFGRRAMTAFQSAQLDPLLPSSVSPSGRPGPTGPCT